MKFDLVSSGDRWDECPWAVSLQLHSHSLVFFFLPECTPEPRVILTGFYEFSIATDIKGNTPRIREGVVIRIPKIPVNVSCYWYKSWDTLMFIANWSAFHHLRF